MKGESAFHALPSNKALEYQLAHSIFAHPDRASIVIRHRQQSSASSSYPAEIVTCTINSGSPRRILFKFCPAEMALVRRSTGAWSRSRGLAYEARLYCEVLQPLGMATQKFYGYGRIDSTEWLAIGYVDGARRVGIGEGLCEAARWIGNFHRAAEGISCPDLASHDLEYYEAVTQAATQNPFVSANQRSVIGKAQHQFCNAVRELCEQPTITHGEYYTNNLLFADGTVYVVDWESAVFAAGELDLTCLFSSCPKEVRQNCITAYAQSRWPEGAPREFYRRLCLARMYRSLRDLGYSKKRARKSDDNYDELVALGRELSKI